MKDDLKEAFKEYLISHDQGILSIGDESEIDVAERAFQRAWEIQQEKIDHLKDISYELEQNLLCAEDQNHYFKLMREYRDKMYDIEKDMKEVASLILTTSYTVNEKSERVMDANEYVWIDRATNILKKYHNRE